MFVFRFSSFAGGLGKRLACLKKMIWVLRSGHDCRRVSLFIDLVGKTSVAGGGGSEQNARGYLRPKTWGSRGGFGGEVAFMIAVVTQWPRIPLRPHLSWRCHTQQRVAIVVFSRAFIIIRRYCHEPATLWFVRRPIEVLHPAQHASRDPGSSLQSVRPAHKILLIRPPLLEHIRRL